jgi:iron complex outermembrane receptor protein
MRIWTLYGATATLALAIATPSLASAAEAADATAGAEAEDAGEAIVVTARRRAENSQDVPIAISVVDGAAMERSGNFTLNQVQQLVPSLQVTSFNPRNTNVNIRGLGANSSLAVDGLEYGVGFYVDGVYFGRPGQSQFDLMDLQQIEVLRGPQGTLFGKNTTAGALNITTRAPSFDPDLTAEASLGDYGYHQVRASGSVPIIADKVAVRLSVADTHRDGFLRNSYDGSKAQDYDNFTARGQLLIQPSETVKISLIGDYSKQKQRFQLSLIDGYFTTYANGQPIANNIFDRLRASTIRCRPPTPSPAWARRMRLIRPTWKAMGHRAKSIGTSVASR